MSKRNDEKVLKAMEEATKQPWNEVEGKQEKLKLLHRKIGQAQGFNLMNLTARIAAVQIIKNIHDSKLYKLEYKTFEEFCQDNFGVGRQSIFDDFKILINLGIAFCRYGDMIGFSYRTIRRISRLSDDKKVAIGDNYLKIGDDILELAPENKKEIEEAIAEVELKLNSEKKRANGYKKMADNREEKIKQQEWKLARLNNPDSRQAGIDRAIKLADDNLLAGFAGLVGAARLVEKKEKEKGERIPERDDLKILLEKTTERFLDAIKEVNRSLKEFDELERIKNRLEDEGLNTSKESE